MSKFSDEDRIRALTEAYATDAAWRDAGGTAEDVPKPQEPQPEPELRPQKLDTCPEDRLHALFDAWIKPLLVDTTKNVSKFVTDELNRERRDYQRDLNDEVRSLRIELTALQETLDELRAVMSAERRGGTLLELPKARASN